MKRFDPPDQFMYRRQGPWPQPSPSYPLLCANEVLNIPELEQLQYNLDIGSRYMRDQMAFAPIAAQLAIADMAWAGPTDADLHRLMFTTEFTRFIRELDDRDRKRCTDAGVKVSQKTRKYDFSAMRLIVNRTIEGTYTAGTILIYEHGDRTADHRVTCIFLNDGDDASDGKDVCIRPGDAAWDLAKLYLLQGAAYHVQFVVHPALHFPMDAVNAITKSAVPVTHPLLQLLWPHSGYQLPLDHAVLESAESLVNNNAQGTRFDPLMSDGYDLKMLFGAGYAGLPEEGFGNAYPRYDYMNPQKGFESPYGKFLQAYYEPFETFCTAVARYILGREDLWEYAGRWMHYNHAHVFGFPDADRLHEPGVLATAMTIYMWDCSVSHAADHANYTWCVTSKERCLRIRIPPPRTADDMRVELAGQIATVDDYARSEMCTWMFFKPWTIKPNLLDTLYAFTDRGLQQAADEFKTALVKVSERTDIHQFMPLQEGQRRDGPRDDGTPGDAKATYGDTIPPSIQY
jgi:hypothetical protein